MDRLNFNIVQQFWTIAKSYWSGDEKWQARGLLLGVVLCLLAYTGLSVVLNNKRGVLISSLSAQDEARFWQTVIIFIGVLVIYAPLLAGYTYLRDRLSLQWRKWLTHRFVDNYFRDRAYYNLHISETEIDNPDQRIAEDVRSFTQESLTFLLVLVESVLSVIAFSSVLWGISKPLVFFLVLYALIGTLVTTVVFGKPLVRLNFEQLKREANLRFSLVRIRENAEAIAFYRGEEQESNQVKHRFLDVFENVKRLLVWELNLNILTNAYEFIPFVLPALVVAPAIFAGEMEVGKVSEAQGAFIRVFFSLNLVVARFQQLTTFGAGINRLYTFAQFLEQTEATQESDEQQPRIQTVEADRLAVEHLSLQTPNYQRTLVEDLSIELPAGQGLLVMGASGCGKSSLLRAIAGLWDSGTGAIVRPESDQILFLPQRPYMVLGTLRDQLLYPNSHLEVENEHLKQVLEQVNLVGLDERFGGFDAEQDWADVLSLGEQQRLTFARLLLNKPNYAILDEATSALDLGNEERLYQHLQAKGTTFLSVGHRSTLANYHQSLLELSQDKTWQIKQPVALIEEQPEYPQGTQVPC
ncbi:MULTISPECIES: ABC transporter ATP-binding protein/permease [unclassified Coleofasciculus]|uniref:ABC transporter ATP-binding protein/permease n=1 Tax=unclassified Coleofasciculus TaxID=2692782 RepID=UPI00187E5783|nr:MULTISPECIES: ABC transporter ATP-binding protein/permease [unclassified Coleofasciculus]MBE9125321.1 ABC transporter ATP-binding protein/permease [Coleofasciculus sp. LEGE 07081]MBE9148525.1 ABC transporter ATP-binding protein/permease [Coleofasciculus sp. LEGE 07092]